MIRDKAIQSDILEAFAQRLLAVCGPLWKTDSIFICDQSTPVQLPKGRVCCTVSAGDGRFPENFQASAGADQLRELGTVIVSPLVKNRLDQRHRSEVKLLDEEIGLLKMKRDILVALCRCEWEPVTDTNYLLAEPPKIVRCIGPADAHVGDTTMVGFRMVFAIEFDWDLR